MTMTIRTKRVISMKRAIRIKRTPGKVPQFDNVGAGNVRFFSRKAIKQAILSLTCAITLMTTEVESFGREAGFESTSHIQYSGHFEQALQITGFRAVLTPAHKSSDDDSLATAIRTADFLRDFPPSPSEGLVNAVIEIPAGSNQKWEVSKTTGHLEWEVVSDTLRMVPYLPYPANYGMVPQTWLPEELGGDNDPLDIIVVGPRLDRGTVAAVRLVGVIKMTDRGEQDDKLIAVDPESWFRHVHTLEDLQSAFPGITEILVTWFGSYKGPGMVIIESVGNEVEAWRIFNEAVKAYSNRQ